MIKIHIPATEAATEIRNQYKRLNISYESPLSTIFEMVSGTFLHFLPECSFPNHQTLFRGILLHQRLNLIWQEDWRVFQNQVQTGFNDRQKLEALRTNPSIICTVHHGAHRLIGHLLQQHKIPFSILVSGEAIKQLAKHFNSETGDLPVLLDADSPTVGLKILRTLKRGHSILFYVDGQSGTIKSPAELSRINFLNQQIQVRDGVGVLSKMSGAPILPVISYLPSADEIYFRFFNPIYPDPGSTDKQGTVVQTIYDLFATFISEFPAQWEGWLSLHKNMVIHNTSIEQAVQPKDTQDELYAVNRRLFGIICSKGKYYILERASMKAYPVSPHLFQLLKCHSNNILKKEIFDVNSFAELLSKEVLIPV